MARDDFALNVGAPLGVLLILTAAVIENPAYARQLRAAVGLAVTTPTATFAHAAGEGRLMIEKGALVEYVRFEPQNRRTTLMRPVVLVVLRTRGVADVSL